MALFKVYVSLFPVKDAFERLFNIYGMSVIVINRLESLNIISFSILISGPEEFVLESVCIFSGNIV